MDLRPVADETFSSLPELKEFCPCGMEVKHCETADGPKFKIGRILTGPGKGICLYPSINNLAMETCKVAFK